MSTPHDPRLSRRDAERLLDDPAATGHPLGPVLDAARAPARADELLREEATVAAFHAARLSPATVSRRSTVPMSPLGRLAATKAVIATGVTVALTTGGIALAATGTLPTLPDQASDKATESVARHLAPAETTETTETTETVETAAATPTGSEATEDSLEDEATEVETEGTTPTPSFEGLCTAYQNGSRTEQGKSLDSAAFTALATEAGSVEGIADYCVALVGEPATTGKPSEAAKPTDAGKSAETGKPSDTETDEAEDAEDAEVETESEDAEVEPTKKSTGNGKPEAPGTR